MYTKEIKSLQHPIVKHLVKLRKERKYREECQTFLVEGKKMIEECPFPIKTLLTTDKTPLSAEAHYLVTPEIIQKIGDTSSPEPYLAEVPLPSYVPLVGQRLLALDGISDPGNLGTLLRTALALGFDGAFLVEGSADPFSTKALRSSKGAVFHLPLQWGSKADLLNLIQENRLTPYVADAQGKIPGTFSFPLILILGNESHGPSQNLKKVGNLISIPMTTKTESLNVAVAGGILMNKIQEAQWQR